ncbi:MAG: hypothetical protein IJZ87_01690 [Bacteroidales bacterium]|nr:hypothetical protein [Bacteroidales bacterium]
MKNLFLILTFIISLNLNIQGQNCQYLVVCPDNEEMRQWADTLARFRNEQGISTKVINIDEIGDNNPSVLRDYFEDIYNNCDLVPSAILLFGDYSDDNTKGITSFYIRNNFDNNIKYLSDNKLVDFDYDNLPEICIARMPAANAQQAELMVRKTMNYEKFPSLNPNYYNHPVTAMGFDESRWFQLCSEIIAGYFEKIGKSPTRLNSINNGTPDSVWSTNANTNKIINYFGPKGLNYIPNDIRYLTEWDATNHNISSAINDGTFLVQHRSHGTFQTWDNPDFTNNDINNLNNKDLTFIMSANCQTGDFGYGEGDNDCFAERFLRVENGAVAVVAASQLSYSFVNDTYVWGFYDYLWNDFMPYGNNETSFKYPAFANDYGKYFLKQSLWPNNSIYKDITYNLFHYFGDAYLQLNTELPQHIAIDYPKEISTSCASFVIRKDKDTRVALSVDGELIATSFGEDSIVVIEPFYKEGKIKIVATKQDHFRHEDFIEVRSSLNDSDLNIYPNPVKDILFVEGKGIMRVDVYNSSGQKLMEINNSGDTERIEINCNMLKKGLFHLDIIYEDRRVGKSFIVM